MFVEDLLNGWKLYGKTGNGSQLNANGTKIKDRQVGWFVGFACKGMQTMTFAYLIVDDDKQETVASLRAKSALKTELTKTQKYKESKLKTHFNKFSKEI